MHNEVPSRFLRIRNLDFHAVLEGHSPPDVTDLATGFTVKGRAFKHQFDALPGVRLLDFPTIDNDGDQRTGSLGGLVAQKG